MKLTTVSIVVCASSCAFALMAEMPRAMAGDLPVRTYTKAPSVSAGVDNWEGFYVGGFVGWARDRESAVSTALPSPGFGAPAIGGAGLAGFGLLPTSHDLDRHGFMGGLHMGYNWQFGPYILGIEGDAAYLKRSASDTQPLMPTFGVFNAVSGSMTVTNESRWVGSVRGRVGSTWNHVMLYATGGVALRGSNGYSATGVDFFGSLNNWPGATIRFGDLDVGYAAGAGAEWMILPNWILRAEYLHYGFKGSSGTMAVVADTCTAAANCRFVISTSDRNIDTVRLGISYKFGRPVIARD